MSEKYLSARVPEALKKRIKAVAAQQDKSVQDFVGEVVISYLNNLQRSSRVETLSFGQQSTIDIWAAALLANDEAAVSVYNLMEMFHDRWKAAGFNEREGPGGKD